MKALILIIDLCHDEWVLKTLQSFRTYLNKICEHFHHLRTFSRSPFTIFWKKCAPIWMKNLAFVSYLQMRLLNFFEYYWFI